jgi:hypothetical protein
MASGMDLAKLKEDWSKAARAKAVLLTFEDKQTHTDVVLSTTGASTERVIAFKLYQDRQRFEASGQVPSSSGQPRQLFRHRETHAEYVQDAADLFVRRFVLRCLNAYDNPGFVGVDIKADPRKKKGTGTDIGKTWAEIAETLPQGTRTSIDEELWKHQREKQLQGGSPFVSATTTKHPIFGSTGKYFEDPTGVAMLDLAKIAQARVVDTHQPEAYKRITGRDAPDPDLPFREKDPDVEKNAAVRDAMRTRELAIIGSVPQEAIVGVEAETAEGRTQYGYDTTRRRWRDPGDLHAEFLEYMRQRRLKEIDEI